MERDSHSILIRGGHVLSMDPAIGDLPSGDVLLSGSEISQVAESIEVSHLDNVEVIDATDMIVIPGFVETHWHLWNCTVGKYIDVRDAARSYFPVTIALGPGYTPDDTYAASRFGLAQALLAGITTVHDWSHNVQSPDHAAASVRAMRDMGLSGRFSYGWGQQTDMTVPIDGGALEKFKAEWIAPAATDAHAPLIDMGIASRNLVAAQSPRGAISMDTARLDWRTARDLGLAITLHANPAGIVTLLADHDLLGPDVLLVHPMVLTDRDCELSAEYGVGWTMSAVGEARYNPGEEIRFVELERAGAPMGLSLDASCTVDVDMFAVMRALYYTQMHRFGRAELALDYRRMLELATIDGARLLGLGDRLGSLTPGKRADVTLIDRSSLNMRLGDPITLLAGSARASDVHTVIAGGLVKVRSHRLTEVDEEHIAAVATESIEQVAARVGW